MADINVVVGANVKRMRKLRGLTQEHMARYLGIDQTLVSKVESGQRSLGVASLEKLCDLFFCSLDDLIGESSQAPVGKAVAFRADGLAGDDLHALAAIGRIVRNLEGMAALEKAAGDEA
ncbi:helix-turn-helix domain-containing protein [Arabiibacter massiliensis]|uniref:helix-turn-helix domain-containing protein n=1 Tax=Arabiibacter massiliensis TaxID=1870985 RepID=UPI00155AEE9B|nr:helix-turn-helix transcriptional regulator [Arabiibacter massiliensis]